MREHAHQLLDQLDNARLAAVVHLLEVMVRGNEEDEEISANEEAAFARRPRERRAAVDSLAITAAPKLAGPHVVGAAALADVSAM